MELINRVDLRAVEKTLRKVPVEILIKLRRWVKDVERDGIDEVRKIRGWNDHSLQGDRKGQRAVYLNKKWRAVYVIVGGRPKVVQVLEVHAHDY